MQDRQVRALAHLVDQPGEHRSRGPCQRRLPGVGGAQLEGAEAQAVPALLGQVDDEAVLRRGPRAGGTWSTAGGRGRPRARRRAADRSGTGGAGAAGSRRRRGPRSRGSSRSVSGIPDGIAHGGLGTACDRRCHGPCAPSSSAPARSRSPTSSRSPGTARASGCPTTPLAAIARGRAVVDDARRATPARTTASRPGSARWPPCPSRRTGAGTCSAAWSARTPPARAPRSSGRWSARSCCCACRRWRPGTPASARRPRSAYAAMLDAGITPVVREYGSLGCSGDLAPLAHCALALMGEGEVRDAAGTAHAAPPRRGSRRSRSPRRRASPSSTARTACSACSCWRCTTSTSC